MPLFLAISGYFLAKKKEERSYFQFWKRQIPKVYVPALIWSLPWYALHLWQGNDWLKGLVMMVACGFSIYYFVALIIQYYLLAPVLLKVKRRGVILAFIITMLAIAVVSFLYLVEGRSMFLIVRAGPFPVWLVFFVVGIYLGKMKERDYTLWPWLLLCVAGLVLSCWETRWLYPLHHTGYGIKPSSHLYSMAVIMLLFSRKVQAVCTSDGRLFNLFVRLGRISFGVYLIHCFFIMAVAHFLHLSWTCLTAAALLLTVSFIYATRRFEPALARRVGF